MTQLTELRAANDLSDVAHLLNLKPGMLSYVLYIEAKGALYKKFDIPKKNGGTREINAPEKSLKLIQYRLSQLLQNCASEISVGHGHLENEDHPGIAHGFKRKHTIMTNARVHVTRRYVFNVDLHDFFGSINFGRVRGFLLKDKNFLLKPAVATVLAQIACHDNQLPQGSPCSPVISNLIGHTLDILLVDMARKYGCTYTRYADDLSFSSNKREFPEQIAKRESEAHAWVVGKTLNRLVTKSGFDFNHTKTRMQYRDSRQEVTGLTVNRKVNSTRTYRHTVRAMVDTLLKTGTFDFIFQTKDEKGTPVVTKTPGSNSQLLGMLSFIDQVDLFDQKLCEKNHTSPANTFGRIKLFRRFLYFDAFYAAPMPVIVCEGKTDNIYIKCAIRSLAPLYPMLASAGSPPKLAVRLFKYSERRISSVTELGEGGVGGLCKLIKHYHDDVTAKFKAPAPKYPVIVLIDNDKGANAVYGAFVGATKTKKPTGTEPFIHVISNLYIVATPLAAGKTESTIEDFFDPALLKTVLNGKTFNPSNNDKEKDNTKYYGKAAFARDVVAKNAATVNFSGFKDILDRLVAVMDDYLRMADERFAGVPRSGITIGLTKEDANHASVALFVVPDEGYYDLFSWVNTFLSDAFPLSQFARVIPETDARNLRELLLSERRGRNRGEQWSSIVLGELLGQGGAENEVASVPYSRATACFSTAVARTWMLYDSESATATVIKRLRKIESDNRFVRRSVTLRDLDVIWDALNHLGDSLFSVSVEDVVNVVCRAAAEVNGSAPSSVLRLLSLENYPGLRSASVEERVVTFQRLVTDIKMVDAADEYPVLSAVVAGAVFLVGRGTSHAFLLKRVSTIAPAASAWFGLMAALTGPAAWDGHWHRACRGVEKILRQHFEWSEPALADLAWAEYDWMAAVFDGHKMFETVSKTVAKVLSIEVIPGAICQLRLAGSSEDVVEAPRIPIEPPPSSKKEKELESSLIQLLELAAKITSKLNLQHRSSADGGQEDQSSLFEGDKYLSSKPPRKRKNPSY